MFAAAACPVPTLDEAPASADILEPYVRRRAGRYDEDRLAEALHEAGVNVALAPLGAVADMLVRSALVVAGGGSDIVQMSLGGSVGLIAAGGPGSWAAEAVAVVAASGLFNEPFSTDEAAAADAATPPSRLAELTAVDNRWVRELAAANPGCPPEALADLVDDLDDDVRSAAAANPNCPPGTLVEFATDRDTTVRLAVLGNPGCPAAARVASDLVSDLVASGPRR